jgi:hypothetical protein
MSTFLFRPAVVAGLLVVAALALRPAAGSGGTNPLPRFTEEREAAALFFVKKHLPDLLPLLGQLKKTDEPQYRREIREIFQATELLADLRDEPQRHDLELKIWVAENKAQVLVAKLSTPSDEERKKVQAELQELARTLVNLEIDVQEHRAEQLERELGEAKDELARMRDSRDRHTKERDESLLNRVPKRNGK